MVWNYQNADYSLKNTFILLFIIVFGTLSFPIWADTVQTMRSREASLANIIH